MRELTVRLRFTTPCLGNVRQKDCISRKGHMYLMPRVGDDIRFEAKWWSTGMAFAANVLGKFHREVKKVHFDVAVDGRTDRRADKFYRRYFQQNGGGNRFVRHEAFEPGDVIGINTVVPSSITNDDFWQLLDRLGRFRGVSPFGRGDEGFGRFEVESMREMKKENAHAGEGVQRRERDASGQ